MLKMPGPPQPTPCLPIVSHHCLCDQRFYDPGWFPFQGRPLRIESLKLFFWLWQLSMVHIFYYLGFFSSLTISLIALRSSCDLTTKPFIYHVPFRSWLQKVFNHSVCGTLVLWCPGSPDSSSYYASTNLFPPFFLSRLSVYEFQVDRW